MARAQLARHDDFEVHVLMPDRAPFRRRHPTALHHAPVAMLRAGGHLELGLARESRYDNLDEKNSISGIWEKWGRHIWGKGVLGIKNNSISDIWEKWGRHIWGKGCVWD